jgi:hypothetical protein
MNHLVAAPVLLAINLVELALFLLPTIVALLRKRRNLWKIILANVFLGPMVIPWFFVLRAAFRDPQAPITEDYICTNCHSVAIPLVRKRKWFFGKGAINAKQIYEGLVPNSRCPVCSAPNPIPLKSPKGQELYARTATQSQLLVHTL